MLSLNPFKLSQTSPKRTGNRRTIMRYGATPEELAYRLEHTEHTSDGKADTSSDFAGMKAQHEKWEAALSQNKLKHEARALDLREEAVLKREIFVRERENILAKQNEVFRTVAEVVAWMKINLPDGMPTCRYVKKAVNGVLTGAHPAVFLLPLVLALILCFTRLFVYFEAYPNLCAVALGGICVASGIAMAEHTT